MLLREQRERETFLLNYCCSSTFLSLRSLLLLLFQVAENIKEFFHHEGIHSTTIQPEFVQYNGAPSPDADSGAATAFAALQALNSEDCALACPKGPSGQPAQDCDSSKCCPTPKSASNTPSAVRRPTAFASPGLDGSNSQQAVASKFEVEDSPHAAESQNLVTA